MIFEIDDDHDIFIIEFLSGEVDYNVLRGI